MDMTALPLFPLATVLFPGLAIPIHVFEPRYRALVADCTAGDWHFGIVGIARGVEVGAPAEPYRVGTLARIVRLERLPDGRANLLALGLARIRLTALEREGKPYLRGTAAIWPDEEEGPPSDEALETRTGELFLRYRQLMREPAGAAEPSEAAAGDQPLPTGPRGLAAMVGALLQVPVADRQQLLEAPTLGERLRRAEALLTREIALMEATHAAPGRNPAELRGVFSDN